MSGTTITTKQIQAYLRTLESAELTQLSRDCLAVRKAKWEAKREQRQAEQKKTAAKRLAKAKKAATKAGISGRRQSAKAKATA